MQLLTNGRCETAPQDVQLDPHVALGQHLSVVSHRRYRLSSRLLRCLKRRRRGYVAQQTMPEAASIAFDPVDLFSAHILIEVLYGNHIILVFIEDLKVCAMFDEFPGGRQNESAFTFDWRTLTVITGRSEIKLVPRPTLLV